MYACSYERKRGLHCIIYYKMKACAHTYEYDDKYNDVNIDTIYMVQSTYSYLS